MAKIVIVPNGTQFATLVVFAWALRTLPPRVALHCGDAATALREANVGEAAWELGWDPRIGSWAHLRIAAGHAHLISGSIEGAADQVNPVLDLPSEYRLATLTEHMATVDGLLQNPRLRGSLEAVPLGDGIREFNRSPYGGSNDPTADADG